MDLRAEIRYPTSEPADAFALIVDRGFRSDVCEAVHALDYDVHVDTYDDGRATVSIMRVMPAELPEAFRRLVGDTVKIVQNEQWGPPDPSGRRTADLLIVIEGQPVTMRGTIELARSEATVRSVIHGDLTVAVPFFGKKIEPEVARAVLAAVEVEQTAATARLRG